MNFSSFFGIFLAIGIVAASIWESGMDPVFFLNFHGLAIVCGGTFTAVLTIFPARRVFSLFKIVFIRILGGHKANYAGTIEQILELNKKASIGLSALNDALPGIQNEFLRESAGLVGSGVLSESDIREVLELRLETIEHELKADANLFKNLAKFPPGLGLFATTLGMIGLLKILGTPGSEKMIGPAMSVGLVGTFYGIGLANFLFLPMAENLNLRIEEEMHERRMIVEAAVLMKRQVNQMAMRENLNSFLLPKDRVQRKAA